MPLSPMQGPPLPRHQRTRCRKDPCNVARGFVVTLYLATTKSSDTPAHLSLLQDAVTFALVRIITVVLQS